MNQKKNPKKALKSKKNTMESLNIFGLPSQESTSKVILLPVPWEVTTSYGKGTALAPQKILSASHQVDLFDFDSKKIPQASYFMKEISYALLMQNNRIKKQAEALAKEYLEPLHFIKPNTPSNNAHQEHQHTQNYYKKLKKVNQACQKMVEWVYSQSKKILSLQQGEKILGIIGGDHSTPLGAIWAIGEKYQGDFGILHIDAHADLRNAYQGFIYSHASIMHNVLFATAPADATNNPNHLIRIPKKIVQVGIRDFCEEEFLLMKRHSENSKTESSQSKNLLITEQNNLLSSQQTKGTIKTYFDQEIKDRLLQGIPWVKIGQEIVSQLPQNVYVSFDIDGLDPSLCPSTGTPVPGGLSWEQSLFLINEIYTSGRKIIGFDLCEVGPNEWDANVGARMLYRICCKIVGSG